ncbi:MAG TPA: hypothetical protein VJL89_08645 [Thermodesulfovibrionia bacterium]|nr:hypothetical protein [Thermodesulfovibrionia bacterium]
MKANTQAPFVVRPLVPEEVYTDRKEFIDYFYNAALEAAGRRTMSTVLLGHRRMGKTEIFKRVVNRLFFEQNPKDPDAVVPVYYSFPEMPLDAGQFAIEYLENFFRYYVGFYTSQPELILKELAGQDLLSQIKESRSQLPFTEMLDAALGWYKEIVNGRVPVPQRTALEGIRRVSDVDDTTTAVFIDEFQNTRMPQHNFDIVGLFQQAVESPTCPHFVTGSAMSILSREIIGRGSLFGRFTGMDIKPLTEYWGAELALKAAKYYRVQVSETMAPIVAERCGGNPYYITAVVRQAGRQQKEISDEDVLNKILAVDLSSGFIWGELNDQVTRWIERINEHKITKWILYLSALEEGDRLDLERIQRELKEKEGKEISLEAIRDVLVKLSRGDLVDYMELGGWFRKVDDPILVEFLKVWGRIEVEGFSAYRVQDTLVKSYSRLKRRFSEYQGYVAEVFMSQVLYSGQNKTLPGVFFHSPEDVQMPWRFFYLEHRLRPGAGDDREIDILGAAGPEEWVCESKWQKGKKASKEVVELLISKAQAQLERSKPLVVRTWLFSHDGLTEEAEALAKEAGVLWSSRTDLDGLLKHLGLRPLPDV